MRIEGVLGARNRGLSVTFGWDSDTGEVWGDAATEVLHMVDNYAGQPYGVPSRYPPESHLVADPLHQAGEMALLLGGRYLLPPELEALYPPPDDKLPDGAVA